jgi:hypothetical protein
MLQKILKKIDNIFSLDYRSLALMRIGLGITLLIDTLQRMRDISAHYSDFGILPRSELLRLWNSDWTFSLHMMSGLPFFEFMLLLSALFFSILLIFGYKTKIAVMSSWILLISIHTRNPMILQGGDLFFRVILFWAMFLPLNIRYSVDSLLNKTKKVLGESYLGIWGIGYIVQVCLLYIFTGILKTGPEWTINGNATYFALHVDQLVTPLGLLLREIPYEFLQIMTFGVLYLEIFGVLLFFIPWKNGFFKILGIFLFAMLQLGFNSTMRLGTFGMIAVVGTLAILPKEFWTEIVNNLYKKISNKGKSGLSIFYDYDCTFCQKISFIIAKILFLNPETKILQSSTDSDIEKIMRRENSWVIRNRDNVLYTSFSGFLVLIKYSPIFAWTEIIFKNENIKILGEKIYKHVAKNRKQVCDTDKSEQKILPAWQNYSIQGIGIFLIGYIIIWNIGTTGKKIMPESGEKLGFLTHLDQQFNMFAPSPLRQDGWYVIHGKLRDGTDVDVFRKKIDVSYKKPELVSYMYKNQRWQKFMMNIFYEDMKEFRLGYGRYLCREWNKNKTDKDELVSFKIIFMTETTPNPNEAFPPIEPKNLWDHSCF